MGACKFEIINQCSNVLFWFNLNLNCFAFYLSSGVARNDKIGRRYDGTPSAPEQNVAACGGVR